MSGPEFEKLGRVLALDVRARWISHAAFNSSVQLLDFGASRLASVAPAKTRFLFLVELLNPAIVLFREIPSHGGRNRLNARKRIRAMRRACQRLGIQVRVLSGHQVRNYFRMRGAKTKQQRASLLAQEFPVLEWKLPPPRRNYDHEHWNMPIFDAVALGVAYFSSSLRDQTAPQSE